LAVELGAVAALKVGEQNSAFLDANERVLAGDVAIERYAGIRDAIVPADRDLPFEGPTLSIERTAENFEQVYGRLPFSGRAAPLLATGLTTA
jgi:hypothetical protein